MLEQNDFARIRWKSNKIKNFYHIFYVDLSKVT